MHYLSGNGSLLFPAMCAQCLVTGRKAMALFEVALHNPFVVLNKGGTQQVGLDTSLDVGLRSSMSVM
jgi:hypothetical protein